MCVLVHVRTCVSNDSRLYIKGHELLGPNLQHILEAQRLIPTRQMLIARHKLSSFGPTSLVLRHLPALREVRAVGLTAAPFLLGHLRTNLLGIEECCLCAGRRTRSRRDGWPYMRQAQKRDF